MSLQDYRDLLAQVDALTDDKPAAEKPDNAEEGRGSPFLPDPVQPVYSDGCVPPYTLRKEPEAGPEPIPLSKPKAPPKSAEAHTPETQPVDPDAHDYAGEERPLSEITVKVNDKTKIINEAPPPEITPGAVGLPDLPTRVLTEPWDSPGGWLIRPQKAGEPPRLITAGARDSVPAGETAPAADTEDDSQDERQIRIEGFDLEEPPVPQVDENAAENGLRLRRKPVVSGFRVDIPDEDGEFYEEEHAEAAESPDEDREFDYYSPAEQSGVNRTLLFNARRYSSRTFWMAMLVVFGAVLAAFSFGAEGGIGGMENTVFSMGGNIICLCFLGWFSLRDIPGGLRLMIKGKSNSDSAFALAYIAALAAGLLPLFTDKLRVGSAVVFTLPVLLAGFWNMAAKNAILQNLQRNFNEWAIRRGNALYSVHAVEDRQDIDDMSTGLRVPDAPILVSQKTLFPANFRREGEDSAAVDRLFKLMLPVAGAFSLALAGVFYAVTKSFAFALAVIPASFTALLPLSLLAAQTIPMSSLRRQLEEDGAMLASVSAAQELAGAKTLALDGVELYLRQECLMTDFCCVREDVRQYDVMLYAAAMLREMDGPAMDACRRQVLFENAEVPALRDVLVERLGISAKIPQGSGAYTVLLGTLKYLGAHEVSGLPDAMDEIRWTQPGLKPLYLAVGGQLMAYMLFSYKPAHHLDKLTALVREGMQLLVATRDPNINEQELTRQLRLTQNAVNQQNAVKIATTRGEEAFQKYRLQEVAEADAAALHDGSAFSFLSLINAAHRVTKAARRSLLAQMLLLAAGTLFFALSLLLGLDAVIAVLALCGIQLGGTLLMLFLGKA